MDSDKDVLPELSSINRANRARQIGDDESASYHDIMTRENARRERLRLKQYFPSPQVDKEKK